MGATKYVVVYEVPPGTAIPESVPFGRIVGLVECRLAAGSGPASAPMTLETVWSDEASFKRWEVALKNWLGQEAALMLPSPSTCRQELQSRRRRDGGSWFSVPKNLGLIVANFGTAVAFIQLLQSQWDWLFLQPDVALVSAERRVELFAGNEFDFDLRLRNFTRGAVGPIRVHSAQLIPVPSPSDKKSSPTASAPAVVTLFEAKKPAVVPRLASGETEKIEAAWFADRPGVYQVRIQGEVEGGLWTRPRRFDLSGRKLVVHGNLVPYRIDLMKVSSDHADVLIELPVAEANKRVECQLLCRSPACRIEFVRGGEMDGKLSIRGYGTQGSTQADWELRGQSRPTSVRLTCRLKSTGRSLTQEQWLEQLDALRVRSKYKESP